KRFVSVEPMLGPINFNFIRGDYGGTWLNALDWLICGGETGPKARPMNPELARDLLRQCRAAGVPFFFKQMSGKQPIPKDLMIREFPNG
ncbi:MAG: DUF5131 family protein, partial [Deltaproteobacteria bacterium]